MLVSIEHLVSASILLKHFVCALVLAPIKHSDSVSVSYIVRPSTRRESTLPRGEFHQFKCKSRFVSPPTNQPATWHVVELKTGSSDATSVCYILLCAPFLSGDVEFVEKWLDFYLLILHSRVWVWGAVVEREHDGRRLFVNK